VLVARPSRGATIWLALSFGVFYTALGILFASNAGSAFNSSARMVSCTPSGSAV
jgi:hypothetical protein